MRKTAKQEFVILIGIVALLVVPKFANFQAVGNHGSEKIDQCLKNEGFQGVALIAKDGQVIFERGYGYANVELQVSNQPQTVFRIASLTKQFTAVAFLRLQQDGRLALTDKVSKFLPDYPRGNEITLHHLLSHSSGIPDITSLKDLTEIQRHPTTVENTLAHFKNLTLDFTPGTDCAYSNSNYIVLGAILEKVTQQSCADYFAETLFKPLQMEGTYLDSADLLIPRRASGYVQNSTLKAAPYMDMSFPHASGALASTARDLYLWNEALHGERLLSKKSQTLLMTPQAQSSTHLISYSYGLRVGPNNRGMEGCAPSILGHFGEIAGFSAALLYYPDQRITLIFLTNIQNTDLRDLHKKVLQCL